MENNVITTATSKLDGRLKVGVASNKKKKKLKKLFNKNMDKKTTGVMSALKGRNKDLGRNRGGPGFNSGGKLGIENDKSKGLLGIIDKLTIKRESRRKDKMKDGSCVNSIQK